MISMYSSISPSNHSPQRKVAVEEFSERHPCFHPIDLWLMLSDLGERNMPQQQTMAEPSGDEHIPGTIFLVDEQHQTSAKHARGRLADVVLIPAPSSDPEDPLNWSPGRKKLSAFCMAL